MKMNRYLIWIEYGNGLGFKSFWKLNLLRIYEDHSTHDGGSSVSFNSNIISFLQRKQKQKPIYIYIYI